MFNFKKFNITQKLTVSFAAIGLIPLLVITLILFINFTQMLKNDTYTDLKSESRQKVEHIEVWSHEYEKAVNYMAQSERVITRYDILKKYHDDSKTTATGPFPTETEEYKKIWNEISPKLVESMELFKVREIYIICASHGHVMYSSAKGEDLGTNLVTGSLKESALGRVWKKVIDSQKTETVDFEPYAADNYSFASFIAAPIYNTEKKMIAVFAIKVSPSDIDNIMQTKYSDNKSNEAFLIGKSNGRISLRSNVKTLGGGKFVIGYEYSNNFIEKALAGEQGQIEFAFEKGEKQLVYYEPVSVLGFNWASITKVSKDEALQSATKLRNLLIIIFLIMGTIIVISARAAGKSIANPIKKIKDVSIALGEGDLTKQVDFQSHDELGELSFSFNQSIIQLTELVQTVLNNSGEMRNTADELALGSSELASRANQEAATLTEISTTIEEFSAVLKQTSLNAVDLNQSMDNFKNMIQSNRELVSEVSSTMQQINDSSKQIDAIVNVINDISFQTNLLALNAAVEAARAGEAGRGFAVVASEVRNLAQKTAESSKTIREIINHNVQSTHQGMELVNKTTNSYKEIISVMQKLVHKIDGITDASNEQSTSIEQINVHISQFTDVINQNASLGEELAASAENLKHNVVGLLKEVNQFKIGNEE